MQLFIGCLLAVLVSYFAYRARSLSQDGAFAAALLGTIVFGFGGWQWAILLLAFFISSSALTRTFKNRKQGLDEKYAKGGARDTAQVLSNGGPAAAFVFLYIFFPQATWPWLGVAAALAAVNADTWATELGVLNPSRPRMITNLRKRVEKGTSGGVSLVGTISSLLGAAVIALLAGWLSPPPSFFFPTFFLVTLAGLLGSLVDSLLGATVQAMYFCPADKKETEKHPLHTCGAPTVRLRGWSWLNNDWVNVLCGISAVIFAGLLMLAFFP